RLVPSWPAPRADSGCDGWTHRAGIAPRSSVSGQQEGKRLAAREPPPSPLQGIVDAQATICSSASGGHLDGFLTPKRRPSSLASESPPGSPRCPTSREVLRCPQTSPGWPSTGPELWAGQ